MATNWHNDDQLYIKFGPNEATPATVGEYRYDGPFHVLEIDLDMTTLTDTNAIINDTCKLPDGAQIDKITVIATTAWDSSGDAATLDLGVIDEDRSSNGNDDALLAAAPESDYTADGNTLEYTQGSDEHGVLVGTVLTKSVYLTAGYDTEAFTAGASKIFVYYHFTE